MDLVYCQQYGDAMQKKTQNSPERNDSMREIRGKVGEGMSMDGCMRNDFLRYSKQNKNLSPY